MLDHGHESQHTMVMSFADLSVWCYPCEEYVHNKVSVCHYDTCCVTVTVLLCQHIPDIIPSH